MNGIYKINQFYSTDKANNQKSNQLSKILAENV